MLSSAEQEVLESFREYLIRPGEMLCFHGQKLLEYEKPLHLLIEKKLLRKERLEGAYCLTRAGFVAMQSESGLKN